MKKKLILGICAALVVGGAAAGYFVYKDRTKDPMAGMDHSSMSMQSTSQEYSLNLMSGKSYLPNQTQMLHFSIQDKDGKTVKDFDTVHEKKMHLIVVRKDRTNFQHVHPTFDQSSGMFMIEPFTFPTDGQYRVFADFTPSSAGMDDMGMKQAYTPYQDVTVGDVNKYSAESIGADRLTDTANGFDAKLSLLEGDSANSDFYAKTILSLKVNINKDGAAYTSLQNYLGALGHMVVLGPNLEFIHAHPLTDDVTNQTGQIIFQVTFPEAGQYKLYLQTQANDQVNTHDFNLTVKNLPDNQQQSQSSQSMEHMGH